MRHRCEQNTVVIDGRPIPCTLSGGVAAYPTSAITMGRMFRAVDASMYQAEHAGWNRVRLDEGSVQLAARRTDPGQSA